MDLIYRENLVLSETIKMTKNNEKIERFFLIRIELISERIKDHLGNKDYYSLGVHLCVFCVQCDSVIGSFRYLVTSKKVCIRKAFRLCIVLLTNLQSELCRK